jgi:hypothetical protein
MNAAGTERVGVAFRSSCFLLPRPQYLWSGTITTGGENRIGTGREESLLARRNLSLVVGLVRLGIAPKSDSADCGFVRDAESLDDCCGHGHRIRTAKRKLLAEVSLAFSIGWQAMLPAMASVRLALIR